jgi:signal transduction histidine kinase
MGTRPLSRFAPRRHAGIGRRRDYDFWPFDSRGRPGIFSALMPAKFWNHVCAAALLLGGATLEAQELPPMTVRQLKSMDLEAATQEQPVRVEGVVTFINVTGGFYLQDDTAGVFVAGRPPGQPPVRGHRMVVDGVTRVGSYTVSLRALGLRDLGVTELPSPERISRLDLAPTRLHGCRVELDAVVRRSAPLDERRHGLQITLGAERLAVELHDGLPPQTPPLIGARVRLRGSIGGVFNQNLQWFGTILRAQDATEMEVLEPAPVDPFALRERPLDSLLQFAFEEPVDSLVKVRGTVTARHGGELFLSDGTRGLRVFCQSVAGVRLGDEMEVAGFPARGAFAPVLEDALVRVAGPGSAPAPASTRAVEILRGRHDAALVTLTAALAGIGREHDALLLTLQDDGRHFTALLPAGTEAAPAWDSGSVLRLTGVASIQQAAADGPHLRPQSFRLLLRTPADVAVLRAPPWWTPQRLAWALAVMLGVIVAALAWGWMLRRRVAAQTALIAEGVKRTAILDERTRLAREFHDTLEQELTGLALQIETASATLPRTPEKAAGTLDLLSRLARRCVEEAGRAVLDLRSNALESADLTAALRDTIASVFVGHATTPHFQTEGEPRRLPPRIEHALLRIAQEAATNTVKHAGASRFDARLIFSDAQVTLLLSDDGHGFAPEQRLDAGQFGLLGMRERVEKIGGRFALASEPGTGTRLEITVPLNQTTA